MSLEDIKIEKLECLHTPDVHASNPISTFHSSSSWAFIALRRSFSRVIHSWHPRHTACLFTQVDNWQRPIFAAYRGSITKYTWQVFEPSLFSVARASGTFVGPAQEQQLGIFKASQLCLNITQYSSALFLLSQESDDTARFRDSGAQHRLGREFVFISTATETRVRIW